MDARLPAPRSAGPAGARARFLLDGVVDLDLVRPEVAASWQRSRAYGIDADRLAPQHRGHADLDTPLARCAAPVLRHLFEQLDGQALAIVLADHAGVVLLRLTAGRVLEELVDRVFLAPGFSHAEAVVGTNGVGTPLEAGHAMLVLGPEHYVADLGHLAGAGVPIRHPITGRTVGVLGLTTCLGDAGPLLMTLARATTAWIRQALLVDAAARSTGLLQAFLRACGTSTGMVHALNDEVLMSNRAARSRLVADDRAALLRHVAEARAARREAADVLLPTGVRVRLRTHDVQVDGHAAGGVVTGRVVTAAPPDDVTRPDVARAQLPGLAHGGPLWRRTCRQVVDGQRAGGRVVVEGEPGVGKLALLLAVHQRVAPRAGCVVLDGAHAGPEADGVWLLRARRALRQRESTVLLAHLDQLPEASLRVLAAELHEAARGGGGRVAVAVRPGARSDGLAALLLPFPTAVQVPPLRHHVEDLEHLVPHFLLRLGHGVQLTCSPRAMQLLLRFDWPGNVAQLLATLRTVLQQRRAGALQPEDLPPEIRSLNRPHLSVLQSVERDAIVMSLQQANGDRTSSAAALGISRATLYRRIDGYGITGSGTAAPASRPPGR